jgi:CheY-like chemotaxis protein
MAPEVLERAFEPFYSTRPRSAGMGLGLALAHAAVAAAGGRIEVTSSPGAGSAFRVCLPPAGAREAAGMPDEPVAAAPAASTGDGSGRRWRVLVVDDEQRVARSTARVLGVSCACTVCTSGKEALELLADGAPYDAVLCDLMMPEMSGAQLYGRVAARWPALASRFVLLTGGAFTSEARGFLEQSRCARMEKPFEAAALRAVVERVASAGEGRAHRHGGEAP